MQVIVFDRGARGKISQLSFSSFRGINKHTTRADSACLMTCTGTVLPVASSVAQRTASSAEDAR